MNQYSQNNVWTPERVERLRQLWRDGQSGRDIATALGAGITRKAVVSKAKRMNLGPHPVRSARRDVARKPKVSRHWAEIVRLVEPSHPPAKAPTWPSVPIAPESKRLSINDLTAHTCRWPEGHPRDPWFGYCGNFKASVSEPYCEYHASLAYEYRPSAKERKAAEILMRAVGA